MLRRFFPKMKARVGSCVLLALLVFSAQVISQQSAEGGDDSVRQTSASQTWRSVEQLTDWERQRVDLRTETPRNKDIPYLPAEPYPFTAPFTAEEMGYRTMDFTHTARWSHVMADAFGTITKAGYLSQGVTVGMIDQMLSPNAQSQIFKQPGEAYSRHMYYYTYPPKNDGVQEMWILRRSGLEAPAKLDYFAYTPSLRRVRRQPPPRRETSFPGVVQSFDDILGVESWEFDWRLLGADVLHETVRFPNNRPQITLSSANGKFYDVATDSIKLMKERYPFYREDGGVNCFVIESTPKREWLADYEVSKIIYWLDQYYFYPLRIERYDAEGKLKMVEVRIAEEENTALPNGQGFASSLVVYFDAQLDLISYSLHDAHLIRDWTEQDLAQFTPDFMRRRWLKYPQKSQSMVSVPEQFYLRPDLLEGRFPEQRPVSVSPAIAARIEAQNKTGHLVFDIDE
ncbi:MAG: DUF1329 domain-containing protein [Gammaproteobacteria bacterium]|nr:DUF1329 domain-containing protein [Gammaproteobacteria bacterium]MBQ0838177.1 DUF1329 domain-containing protein [Gammaproteobacteria bacterium]